MSMVKLTLTDVQVVPLLAIRPVERWFTPVTIDTLRVVLTVLTHTAPVVVPVNVQRLMFLVHLLVVLTFRTVVETVASCKHKLLKILTMNTILLKT